MLGEDTASAPLEETETPSEPDVEVIDNPVGIPEKPGALVPPQTTTEEDDEEPDQDQDNLLLPLPPDMPDLSLDSTLTGLVGEDTRQPSRRNSSGYRDTALLIHDLGS